MRLVGAPQYRRLVEALMHYEHAGFKAIDVPWAVSKEAMDITRPAWAGPRTLSYEAGGVEICPVASAEQSFLQLQLDAVASGNRVVGDYVTMTPCFRNEPVLDDLHQPYFMKVELISWDSPDREARNVLDDMLLFATDFFDRFVETVVIENEDPDPIGDIAYDIVTYNGHIELGSYGIRNHPKVGRWIYGTGCAEPRLSYAIEIDNS